MRTPEGPIEFAGEHLRKLSGLIRPLVQRQWSAMVARINRQASEEARLDEYPFGLGRIDLDPVRRPLREIQSNHCFYCRQPISGIAEVDHFIPWTRHPDNGIENLVATDSPCNNSKRSFLAAVRHVDRWMERFQDAATGRDLREVAGSVGWESHRNRTRKSTDHSLGL